MHIDIKKMKKKYLVIRFANYGENVIFLQGDGFFGSMRTKAKNFDSELEAEVEIVENKLINACIIPTYIEG